ncbi:4Fe-4S dicluster domain-containing protein [Frigoriglobus tundricola]|uniref:4Fe-4S ferredoxin, iron-sulfur binding n=1 Tax=Frigoriglobus tundricola TaxID=2774151 RepID=A0A6M5YVS9_9BACT|nr:ferredoxin family protein [Frigoriglobus tundricola]QJW97486.1 4Fe-4S ferredoxin, iron-sulfur binding [Frigoriglobus tundricola]
MKQTVPERATCDETPGRLVPIVSAQRCENKGPCVQVCPYDVFEIRKLTPEERGGLSLLTRLKVWVHGGKQAFVVRPGECHACGLCVTACPEKAITLSKPAEA